jgi:hypothetical protein
MWYLGMVFYLRLKMLLCFMPMGKTDYAGMTVDNYRNKHHKQARGNWIQCSRGWIDLM